MATISAQLTDGSTDSLIVDAFLQEEQVDAAEMTTFPVEVGANITDHVRPIPSTLTLTCLFSNTPLTGDLITSAENARDVLSYWRANGALLTLDTSLGKRERYAIHNISTIRDAKTGGPPGATGGLRITLSLRRIEFVQNKLVRVKVSKDKRTADNVKKGARGTKNPDTTLKKLATQSTNIANVLLGKAPP